ncbi:MAG: hypothetical protein AB7E31_03695 [Desulfitobacterium sp.]
MKNYDQLEPYVSQIAHQYQTGVGSIVRNIREPILAGFIQAKMSYARENGCELHHFLAEINHWQYNNCLECILEKDSFFRESHWILLK